MLEQEVKELTDESAELRLPCLFCRHYQLCHLWEDGRETCASFSR